MSGPRDFRQAFARCTYVGIALGLLAAPSSALAQKMSKCPDGKGGWVFQQGVCPETPEQAEARAKERERAQAEVAKKKDDEARKKEESIQKAKDRERST